MSVLFHNEDCTNFFMQCGVLGADGGAAVDAYVDQIAAGGVTAFLCNTNAERTNYAGDAWEPFWQGYNSAGANDQPYLAGIATDWSVMAVASWRRLVDNMLTLHQQGIDYPARVIARCRHHGMAPWITLRMNDVHVQDNPAHPIHSDFWRSNPQLRRQGYDGYYGRALDYAHAEVRDHYMALINETLDRYDIDGLELDFLREPYLFSRGKEEQGGELLTAWLTEVRRHLRRAETRRGHPIRLGVRTPSRPEVARRCGLDPVAWARCRLVDQIVVGPRWATLEYAMPLREWRRLLEGTDVALLGGLEVLIRPYRSADQRGVTPEEACGAAAQILHEGADGVYLFNYFPDGSATGQSTWWSRDIYQQTLRDLASLDRLSHQPRRHVVTFNDVKSPDGNEGWGEGHPQLPAVGSSIGLRLPTGPCPPDGWHAELTLRFEPVPAMPPTVRINDFATPMVDGGGGVPGQPGVMRYVVPVAALCEDDANTITLVSADGEPLRITWADIQFSPES